MIKGIILVVLASLLLVVPAGAQYNVVPSGAVWPDGSIGFLAPVGAPITVRTHDLLTAPYLHYASPLYWVPAPYISVPMLYAPQPHMR